MEEKITSDGADSRELLEELLRCQERELRYLKAVILVGVVMTAVLLVAALVAVPRLTTALAHAESSLARINALSGESGDILEHVDGLVGKTNDLIAETNDLVTEAQELIDNANRVVVDNTTALTEAVTKINGVDFARLNEAISDLADTVKPLANFVHRFG